MQARTVIEDFATANNIYVNAEVTFYKVEDGEKMADLADVYGSLTGNDKVDNPQTLDSFGKFRNPVYVQEAVIMTVRGLTGVPDHDTGVVGVVGIYSGTGSPQGVVAAAVGSLYTRTDGGASTTLYVKESGTGNTGWVAK